MSFLVNTPWDKFDHVLRKVNFSWKWPPKTYTAAKKSGTV